ncbi:hypothetical protein TNIN_148651 [Trichonephila inaurata madagascariensis]|uniref:Uncharacterized protein n=1 Tax=Trichonephila inaurata madagascariensis TaxID=2747483 RepID=A0A8X6X009_9ARAC|nr:hypothetical protein TNIN_148651 [Trichonephila inaurata madagascariensis]
MILEVVWKQKKHLFGKRKVYKATERKLRDLEIPLDRNKKNPGTRDEPSIQRHSHSICCLKKAWPECQYPTSLWIHDLKRLLLPRRLRWG